MWVYGAACAIHVILHLVFGIGPQSSYVLWLEVSSALLRLGGLSYGAWLMHRRATGWVGRACCCAGWLPMPCSSCHRAPACMPAWDDGWQPAQPHLVNKPNYTQPTSRRFLDDINPPASLVRSTAAATDSRLLAGVVALRAGAGHVVLLLMASSCLAMCQLALFRPMRLA